MILDQIHPPGITVQPFEGDAPWPVHMNGVTFWFTFQAMKIEPGNVQIFQPFRFVQRCQPDPASLDQIRRYTALIVLKE